MINKSFAVLLNRLLSIIMGLSIFVYSIEVSGQATATLTGIVTDINGDLIANAEIIIINNDDGRKQTTKSSKTGDFSFASMPPGSYSILINCTEFVPIKKIIALRVGSETKVNVKMAMKQINESLSVQGSISEQQHEVSVGLVINYQQIEKLPLNGRSYQNLLGTATGVATTTPPYDDCIHFANGQRCTGNYITINGVSGNTGINPGVQSGQTIAGTTVASNMLGTTSGLVSVDEIDQVKITTSTFAAEYGRTPGAQVAVITRSGTNEFHGSIFENLRNDKFDANDWFNNAQQLPKSALRQNNFGGVLGGPIKKDRTFFFISYEGARLRLPQFQKSTVPSLNARLIAVENIKPFLAAFPLPNGKDLNGNLSEFNKGYSNSALLDAVSIRFDHVFRPELNIFGRYSYSPSKKSMRGTANTEWPFSANTLLINKLKTQTMTIGVTSFLGLNTTNDLRINWSHNEGNSEATPDNFGGAIPFDPGLVFPLGINTKNGFFFMSLSSGINSRIAVGALQQQAQRQLNFVDTFSFQRNSHLFKVGGDFRKLSPTINLGEYQQVAVFAGVDGAVRGRASIGFIEATAGAIYPICKNLSLFGQDTWRPTSNLSITVGTRWELNPPPEEKYGKDQYALINIDDPTNLDLAPRGTPLYKTTYNNFAPRFGIAYSLINISGRETILRGGFGKYFDVLFSPIASGYGYGFPYMYSKPQIINEAFPFNSAIAERPEIVRTQPYDFIPSAVDPHLKLPYSYHWNVALQQSLGLTQNLSLSYVGALGRRLTRNELINEPNPKFTQIYVTRNLGSSDYHSLQVAFHQRMPHLQTIASYTWAHSLDNVSSDIDTGISGRIIDLKSERASSNYDIRHSFNMAMTYDLNLPKLNKYVDPIIRDWSISSMFVARSAQPINIVTGQAPEGDMSGVTMAFRPDLVPGVPIYIYDSSPGGKRINPDAFVIPNDRQGMLGRNSLRGFSMWQQDFALYRSYKISEKVKLRVSAEIFNIWNHPNFADPGTYSNHVSNILTSPQFGRSTAMLNKAMSSLSISTPNQLYSLGGPRSIQFTIKLSF